MSAVVDAVNQLLHFPESIERVVFPSHSHETSENRGVSSIPVDILDSPKEYIFYMDVPGLSKSEIQVGITDAIFNFDFNRFLAFNSIGGGKWAGGNDTGMLFKLYS